MCFYIEIFITVNLDSVDSKTVSLFNSVSIGTIIVS